MHFPVLLQKKIFFSFFFLHRILVLMVDSIVIALVSHICGLGSLPDFGGLRSHGRAGGFSADTPVSPHSKTTDTYRSVRTSDKVLQTVFQLL